METQAAPGVARQSRLDPAVGVVAALALVGLVVLGLGILISSTLPYGEWDAMAYGIWSRLIATHFPHIRFSQVGAADYHRPVFYVLQGTLWRIFGFHEALGRLLSFAFSVLLAGSVAYTAARLTIRRYALLTAALAVGVVIACDPFERYIAAGLSDIPTAALVALCAVTLVAPRLGRARVPLLALTACLALLAKPSAFPALVGLGAAVLLGPRADLRRRAVAAGALAFGTAVALVYDEIQARYVHIGLRTFMTTGTDGFYVTLGNARRRDTLLDVGWLGGTLRVLLVFAFVYALVRLVSRSHRLAVAVAFPLALVWSWLGPYLAADGGSARVGLFGYSGLEQVVVLLFAASLLFALAAPAEVAPSRLELARLLVWAAPPLVIWAVYGVYDIRLAAPAWPPLFLLMARALVCAFAGASIRREAVIAVPAVALVALGVYGAENMNGLGSSGWHAYTAAGFSGLSDAALMRNIALGGDFSAEVNALAPQVQPGDTIVTGDTRLEFRYGSQVRLEEPQSCNQLAPSNRVIFVLLESDEERTLYGDKATSAYWQRCAAPKLTLVTERPGAFALFTAGAPLADVGGCGAPPRSPQAAVQFGTFRTAAAAAPLFARLRGAGFVEARVEKLGCSNYQIVEYVPSTDVGQSVVQEATGAGFKAKVVSP